MILTVYGPSIALFVSLAVYGAMVLTTIALMGPMDFALTSRVADSDTSGPVKQFLSPRAAFLCRIMYVASLLGVFGSVLMLIQPLSVGERDEINILVLVVAAGLVLASVCLILGLATYSVSRFSQLLGPALRQIRRVLEAVASLPLVRLALPSGGQAETVENGHVNPTELEDNLDLLEAVGIKTREGELRMIRGVLRMDSVRVREVMRPRVDMVVSPVEAEPDAVVDLMAVGGYSKIPVHGETIDDIVGVVYSRDLLKAINEGKIEEDLLKRLARPAIFVPEAQNLEHLLRAFRLQRTHLAIVVDEYGGVSGLVTVSDLVEEIVGELMDEFDVGPPELQRIRDGEFVIDGTFSVEDLNHELETNISAKGFDTIAGLVFKELGKMPALGDRVYVDGLKITVQSIAGRRIRRLSVIQDFSNSDRTDLSNQTA